MKELLAAAVVVSKPDANDTDCCFSVGPGRMRRGWPEGDSVPTIVKKSSLRPDAAVTLLSLKPV